MTDLRSIADKLGKLIPRLGTEHDGEVVSTARAIDRTLRGAGLDWHVIARAVCSPAAVVTQVFDREDPKGDPGTWRELAKWCRDNDGGRLRERERQFIADMVSRLVLGGSPTPKQGAWLRGIYTKLQGRAP